MTSGMAGVDMRGFRPPLAALERKLGHDLDRARSDLAALGREARVLAELRQELAGQRADQLQFAGKLLAGAVDPSAYGRCLRYLAAMERRVQERSNEAGLLETRLAAARQACVEADRRLACLRALRESAEAAYALAQSRRDAKQADLAWLARACAVRATAAKRVGASW